MNEILSKKMSLLFFGNPNWFGYNIYNFFFKLIFIKKIFFNDPYFKDGLKKINSINKKYIDNINNELGPQLVSIRNGDLKTFQFTNTDKINLIVKKIINEDLSHDLNNLGVIYNNSIKFSNYKITRNFHFDYSKSESEYYSDNFHTDNYLFTLIKVFINLHDVTENHGPLEVIKKKNKKSFLKNSKNLLSNFRVKNNSLFQNLVWKNTGKAGDVLVCNTTENLHRASVPEKDYHRDILFLEFIIVPRDDLNFFSLEKDYKDIYMKNDATMISRIISKPKNIFNLAKNFLKFLKLFK